MNAGYTPGEIADQLKLPASLRMSFENRGYYGTVKHNTRAVYQHYLGWYDGNPAHLDPLPPEKAAPKYIQLMGGSNEVIRQAQTAFNKGEYRWAAELLNHLVFAEPDNDLARGLLAKTYDQLGYQAESGPWRDSYLTAAFELRHGGPEEGIDMAVMENILRNTPVAYFFDSMSVRLNGPEAEDKSYRIIIHFSDQNKRYLLYIKNAVLHYQEIDSALPAPENTDATLNITKELFIQLSIGKAGLNEILFSDDISFNGSKLDLIGFFALFDQPTGDFNIVTP